LPSMIGMSRVSAKALHRVGAKEADRLHPI
jgi:hypothetical protein